MARLDFAEVEGDRFLITRSWPAWMWLANPTLYMYSTQPYAAKQPQRNVGVVEKAQKLFHQAFSPAILAAI
jgi:hypothetical protein